MAVGQRIPDFDLFGTLGVTPDDPPDVVKAAWRARVKEHHPDTSGGSDAQIKRINVAYDWLRDPTLRSTYLAALAARAGRAPRWGIDLWPDQDGSAGAGPVEAVEPDEPPGPYVGPRADRISAVARRISVATMPDLLDLVHSYRPDLRWSLALARAIDASGRHAAGTSAVWQLRAAVRERIETLLESPEVRATYDEELVGQVVSDRLADLARAIVLLDVLTPPARDRVAAEWAAILGYDVPPPTDEVAIGDPPGPLAEASATWSRAPDGFRWVVGLLAAGTFAAAAVAFLPSRDAVVAIVLGLMIAGVAILSRRPRRG
jgi:curved DNA-binding protein CbpA